jgi:hypothetical protein
VQFGSQYQVEGAKQEFEQLSSRQKRCCSDSSASAHHVPEMSIKGNESPQTSRLKRQAHLTLEQPVWFLTRSWKTIEKTLVIVYGFLSAVLKTANPFITADHPPIPNFQVLLNDLEAISKSKLWFEIIVRPVIRALDDNNRTGIHS